MLIAPMVLAAIISAVGALGSSAANANKPPPAELPKPPPPEPDAMTGGSSKAALATGQKGTVADAFPPPQVTPQPQQAPGGFQMSPEILELLKKMGGF